MKVFLANMKVTCVEKKNDAKSNKVIMFSPFFFFFFFFYNFDHQSENVIIFTKTLKNI